MKTNTKEPMNAFLQFCPNMTCSARGQTGQGNIRLHDRKRERYFCRSCCHTFSARRGTMVEGLRTPMELVITVVILLAYGLDERTIANWQDRAGNHYQRVHHAVVKQGTLDLVHVQADEIRVKGRSMMVSARLWLEGVVSCTRDTAPADLRMAQVHACSQVACALFVCTDGWVAYPNSIRRAFREKVKETAGRACLYE